MDVATAEQCLGAGSQFIVSPATVPALVPVAHAQGAPVILGALTPTEVVTAAAAGADYVKVFPVSAVGGPGYLKALSGPLPHIKFAPTGGINLETLGAYVAAGATLLGAGGALADYRLLEREGADAVAKLAARYVDALRAARSK